MTEIARPFRALRPTAASAADVIAPPYDVVDTDEARQIVAGRPHDFLRISRPEVDFPPGTDAHSDAVYARGADNLAKLEATGILVRETTPCYYVYRMTMAGHEQTGLALTASVQAYREHRVKRHELTRPDKEDDRVNNMLALNAQTGPVLSVYRDDAALAELLGAAASTEPLFSVEGPHRVTHTVWRVDHRQTLAAIDAALAALGSLYIADGHHRSAAAARVAERMDRCASAQYFLSVAFPASEMRILDYNRVVGDLGGHTPESFLSAVAQRFDVARCIAAERPQRPNQFAMYLDGHWYRLNADARLATGDPVADLDVSILHRELIEPLLDIRDPRTNPRVDFVGGIRGLDALQQRVDAGRAAAAFALHPTSIEQLLAVADAGDLMPPKSTWFEPKLADGLLAHVLD